MVILFQLGLKPRAVLFLFSIRSSIATDRAINLLYCLGVPAD
jgi:hypothetical protein